MKKFSQNFCLPTSFRDFRLMTSFRGPPDVFLKKYEKNLYPNVQHAWFWGNMKKFSQNFSLPTSFRDFSLPTSFREPPNVFLKKVRKKYVSHYTFYPSFSHFEKIRNWHILDLQWTIKPIRVSTSAKLFDAIAQYTQENNLPKFQAI